MWVDKDRVICSYSLLTDNLFKLLFELQTECGHVSKHLNRPELVERLKSLVDEDGRIRGQLNGQEEILLFRDPERYAEQLTAWEDSVREFDENSVPPVDGHEVTK